jgi:hypothetical protein
MFSPARLFPQGDLKLNAVGDKARGGIEHGTPSFSFDFATTVPMEQPHKER